jgi:hypothetical protein
MRVPNPEGPKRARWNRRHGQIHPWAVAIGAVFIVFVAGGAEIARRMHPAPADSSFSPRSAENSSDGAQ